MIILNTYSHGEWASNKILNDTVDRPPTIRRFHSPHIPRSNLLHYFSSRLSSLHLLSHPIPIYPLSQPPIYGILSDASPVAFWSHRTITFHICHLQTRRAGQYGHPVDNVLAGAAGQRLLGNAIGRHGLSRLVPARLRPQLQVQSHVWRPQAIRLPPDERLSARHRHRSSPQAQPAAVGRSAAMVERFIHRRRSVRGPSDSHGGCGQLGGTSRSFCGHLLPADNRSVFASHGAEGIE